MCLVWSDIKVLSSIRFPTFKVSWKLSQSTELFSERRDVEKNPIAHEGLPQVSLKSAEAVSSTVMEAELELNIRTTFMPIFIPESENLM